MEHLLLSDLQLTVLRCLRVTVLDVLGFALGRNAHELVVTSARVACESLV